MENSRTLLKFNILLLEDSPVVAGRTRNMLTEMNNISVTQATNMQEAMIILHSVIPEIVLIGLHLSGGKGIDFLKEIKRKYFNTVIIILSNHSESYYRKLCIESGADFFFDKSSEFEKVQEAISSLLIQNKKSHIPG